MDKWADYVITAFKRGSGLGVISQVQQHEDKGNEFGKPELVDKIQVAHNIRKGKKYMTVYKINDVDWEKGDTVRTFLKDGTPYIRNDKNIVASDNLGEIPEIQISQNPTHLMMNNSVICYGFWLG